jgi:hypothetical protein
MRREYNQLVQPGRRFGRTSCNCKFRDPRFPLEVARCDCGYLWRADERYPHQWKPLKFKHLIGELRQQIAEYERIN